MKLPAAKLAQIIVAKRDTSADDTGELLNKCVSAIDAERYDTLSKSDLEGALDEMAHQRVDATGETFYKSYDQVVRSDVGRKLYSTLIGFGVEPPDAA